MALDRQKARKLGIEPLDMGASYATTPNLKALREALGLSLEEAGALTTYGVGVLKAAEDGSRHLPRIVISRLTAEIGSAVGNKEGISHREAKGE